MRALLVGPDYEENLSIRYLSSSLQAAGHETELATFNLSSDITDVVNAAENADIVGLSLCFQSRAQEFLHLAQRIKDRDPNKLIVAGGHYASCAAEPLLTHHPELDVIVIHEGEQSLVEIADAMPTLARQISEIPGIAYRDGRRVLFTQSRRTLDDLDALPFPDRRGPVHFIAGVPTSYLMGSRGCYGNCAYCCITTLHRMAPGKRFRQRSVDRIADEMLTLYRERGTRQFVFHDDNFLVPSESLNLARIAALEQALNRRSINDIALVIKCRPADATPKVFRRLKDLGLVRVFLGVESATEQGLEALERKQRVEDSVRALEMCADLDISAQFTLMIFHPEATLDTLRSDITFMRRFSRNPLNFCRAEIYAGTPLEQRMVAQGRARGDYLGREYNLADPDADLACELALDLFYSRCWGNGSLIQHAIGLDHTAAVASRFHRDARTASLCELTSKWLESANTDTIDLLEHIIDLSASGTSGASLQRALRSPKDVESSNRQRLMSEGMRLGWELAQLRLTSDSHEPHSLPMRVRFARRAAAAVLAIGLPASSACQQGVSEMAPPPLKQAPAPPLPLGNSQDACSIVGTITDVSGAVVATATITVTNTDLGLSRTVKTNDSGQYLAIKLPAGHYSVKAEASYFKTTQVNDIALKAGETHTLDIKLDIGNWGVCEVAAPPLQAIPNSYEYKKKPFTYQVGETDNGETFTGIAKLVYGDPKMWVQIFEANRDVAQKPGDIHLGTSIVIPPRKRHVPKLISRVLPAYPPEALRQHLSGEVVLDVTLNEDGTVKQVDPIDGDALLTEAAANAVKQWRYKPLVYEGKPVQKFVVVLDFEKRGEIKIL
jgi:TonB family protein